MNSRLFSTMRVVLCVLLFTFTFGDIQRYVSVNSGSDTNDCTSMDRACASVQGALNSLPVDVESASFSVSPGTYTGNQNVDLVFPPITLSMTSGDKTSTIFDCGGANINAFSTNGTLFTLNGFTIENCNIMAISELEKGSIHLSNVAINTCKNGVFSSSLTGSVVTFFNITSHAVFIVDGSLSLQSTKFNRCISSIYAQSDTVLLQNCNFEYSGMIQISSNISTTLQNCSFSSIPQNLPIAVQTGGLGTTTISSSDFTCNINSNQTVLNINSNTSIMSTSFENCDKIFWQSGSLEITNSNIVGLESLYSIYNVGSLRIQDSQISSPTDFYSVWTTPGISVNSDNIFLSNSNFTTTSFRNTGFTNNGVIQNCVFEDNYGFALDITGVWEISNSMFGGANQNFYTVDAIQMSSSLVGLNNLTVISSTFSNCTKNSGSAIVGKFSTLSVLDSDFNNNFAPNGTGSSISTTEFYMVTIEGSSFTGNTGASGALFLGDSGGISRISNSVFRDNVATFSGGAINGQGSISVAGSTFDGNECGSAGGGIFASFFTELSVTDCTFTSNTAQYGGAIGVQYLFYYVDYGNTPINVDITGCTFDSNSVLDSGDGSVFACIGFYEVPNFTVNFDDSNEMNDNEGNEIDCDSVSDDFPWLIVVLVVCAVVIVIAAVSATAFIYKSRKNKKAQYEQLS